MSPWNSRVMAEDNIGSFFDDVHHLYTHTAAFIGSSRRDEADSTTAAAAASAAESGSRPGSGSGTTTPQTKPKPSYDSSAHAWLYDFHRRTVVHILRSWERTALHQYADYEIREELVRDMRLLYTSLDRLFFGAMLRKKHNEHNVLCQIRPCERARLDIFDSMPSAWCGLRRYLGVRRHAFASGSGGGSIDKRCRGLRRGGVVGGCCGGVNGKRDKGEEVVQYDEHPGATVWTSLLCRSAKSMRRRRRLRIGLVLRSPDDGGHYSIEHLLRALVHEMCHAYIEKMWEPHWPDADYEAFVRNGGDGHGVLWQALCWKVFEEIESWGVDSAQGLRRQEPMLEDLALNRTGVVEMPEETRALFRSLGRGWCR
ncbi:hypothetical protein PG985_000745 [Apiospora marii]|uniref:SprT-like domain-containing protein n=1 Tax=Apiospora marii TaxID=335849 RepID=A0ABR1R3Q6_9PEZI